MHLTKEEITATPRVKRLNIINAVSGVKSANLIATVDDQNQSNLAIFSSVVHLGSNPALLGFVLRPNQEVKRHTYENILETGSYTINHVHQSFYKKAHYTSAKFDRSESEFDKCRLTEEYLFGFEAPFVGESKLKMGMKHVESIHIPSNNTYLVVGSIEHLVLPDEAINESGYIDLSITNTVGMSGLNSYYSLSKVDDLPYARVNELPDFGE